MYRFHGERGSHRDLVRQADDVPLPDHDSAGVLPRISLWYVMDDLKNIKNMKRLHKVKSKYSSVKWSADREQTEKEL